MKKVIPSVEDEIIRLESLGYKKKPSYNKGVIRMEKTIPDESCKKKKEEK